MPFSRTDTLQLSLKVPYTTEGHDVQMQADF